MTYAEAKRTSGQSFSKDEFKEAVALHGEELVSAALECDVQLEDIAEAYQGEFASDEEFAQNMAEEIGAFNKIASWPYNCIDWKHAAKDLMYDYVSDNGHYFRSL